jgi:GT2 family glycosyltransferase
LSIESVFIILNWHTPELVDKLLTSLEPILANKKDVVTVVEQESEIEPESYFKHNIYVDVLTNKTNLGVPKGYNRGIIHVLKIYKPKYIFIMNSDIEVLPGCIDKMIQCAKSDPKIGIVGGKALRYG